jgi:hypothetical protein
MKETVIIKWFLISLMIIMSFFSFYLVYDFDDNLYKYLMFISGCFFLYESIWIYTLKTKE